MCEHCRSGKMWKEDKEEDVCEWSNPEPLEDEDELPPMCPTPATRVVWDRHVEDHLCDEHVDQENVDLDRGVGDLHRGHVNRCVNVVRRRPPPCRCGTSVHPHTGLRCRPPSSFLVP